MFLLVSGPEDLRPRGAHIPAPNLHKCGYSHSVPYVPSISAQHLTSHLTFTTTHLPWLRVEQLLMVIL